jgi:Skp family chaperone for outer membrane proteins
MIVLLWSGALAGAAEDVPPARDLKIAVVDIAILFRDYHRSKVMRDGLLDQMRAYRNRVESQQRRLAQKEAELREFAAGTAEHLARREDIAEKAKELRALQMEAETAQNAAWIKLIREIYSDVNEAAAAYAKEKKIDLVIKQQSILDTSDRADEARRDSLILDISRRGVLYHSEALDITTPILQRLNEAYARRQAESAKEGKAEAETTTEVKAAKDEDKPAPGPQTPKPGAEAPKP